MQTPWKSQFYFSFSRSKLISCERAAADHLEIAILPQFLTIEPHFVRKDCLSWRLVANAPAPAEREKDQEGEREKKEKERRKNVKLRRCERRCEDEQI